MRVVEYMLAKTNQIPSSTVPKLLRSARGCKPRTSDTAMRNNTTQNDVSSIMDNTDNFLKRTTPLGENSVRRDEYPTGSRLFLILVALCFAIFVTPLDTPIPITNVIEIRRPLFSTAIPEITNEFQGIQAIGWPVSKQHNIYRGGVLSGSFTLVAFTAVPEKRAAYTGFAGAAWGVASIVGPSIGGLFTSHVS
ncbi:hypothetical protein V8E51_002512 [Hyaloscypha variabilis]